MVIFENETNFKIDTEFLEKIVNSLTQKDIECIFINNKDMQELNFKKRGIDKTTDVLSFPLDDLPFVPLGSIVINAELSFNVAKNFRHSFSDEIALLFIHGLLHLLGFDHETDNGEMRKKEKELIEKFYLPKNLIDRTFEDE